MPVARTTKQTFPFVLTGERELPTERQTVFHLRALSTEQWLALRDLEKGGEPLLGRWLLLALRLGVAGWDRFPDAEGNATPFEATTRDELVHGVVVPKGSATKESVNFLATEHATEIAFAIIKANGIDANDLGN
jgi:hypothetical protein